MLHGKIIMFVALRPLPLDCGAARQVSSPPKAIVSSQPPVAPITGNNPAPVKLAPACTGTAQVPRTQFKVPSGVDFRCCMVEGPTTLTANGGVCGVGSMQPTVIKIDNPPEPPQCTTAKPAQGVTTIAVSTNAGTGLLILGALIVLGFILLH